MEIFAACARSSVSSWSCSSARNSSGLIRPSSRPGAAARTSSAVRPKRLALLSRAKRAELEATVRRVEHCRLETHPRFFDFFVDGCQFLPLLPEPVPEEPVG